VSYAQGMQLIGVASELRNWNVNRAELARIWKAGCIIRARFLKRLQEAYTSDPKLSNLLLDASFVDELKARQQSLREVVMLGAQLGLALPATGSALAYYDAYRSAWLPANLIQAQRDYFGAHTYKRIDREGDFHTEWAKP
jgi:6-phosphogluconate dehydrogenase